MTRISQRLALAATVLVTIAGCGGAGGAEIPAEPAQAPPVAAATEPPDPGPDLRITDAVRDRLENGDVGVVDFAGVASIAPRGLRPNKEQELSKLRWTGWGGRRAIGTGEIEMLECSPTCGRGLVYHGRATLTLTEPRACGARRYYAQARLTTTDPETDDPVEPAVYLRTPC